MFRPLRIIIRLCTKTVKTKSKSVNMNINFHVRYLNCIKFVTIFPVLIGISILLAMHKSCFISVLFNINY